MTDEKPTPEQDGIAAALSALSNAATPAREDASTSEAAPEAAVPPPPPAPDAAEEFPPPTGAPVAVNAAAAMAAVPPAPTVKRKKWPWILALCIVGGVLLLGGLFACASSVMNVAFHAVQPNERHYDYDDYFSNRDAQDGLWSYYYGGRSASFDELIAMFNVDEGEVTADSKYGPGIYRVGGQDGIASGLYYLEGSQTGVSNYYVFHSDDDDDEPLYDIEVSVEYFGNYYTELEDGDVIIFKPSNTNDTMYLAQGPMEVVPPYESGCYRVGIDIPAGTYTITCDAEAARETDSEAGAYVMKDLEFDEDSITESVYVIKGGRQTLTVNNGEYLELFAAIATPATASTKVPLHPAESERPYAA